MRQSARQTCALRSRRARAPAQARIRVASSTRNAIASCSSISAAADAVVRTPASSTTPPGTWSRTSSELREHLGIERWLVFGGSWGSTLSLAYAQSTSAARDRAGAAWHLPVAPGGDSLVLPGGRQRDISRSLGALSSHPSHRPSARTWSPRSIGGLPATIRSVALEAAKAWSIWEAATSYLHVNQENIVRWSDDEFATAVARIECHYFVNRGFFHARGSAAESTRQRSGMCPRSSCRDATMWSAR